MTTNMYSMVSHALVINSPKLQCVICDLLANSSLKPSLLRRHLETTISLLVSSTKVNEWKNNTDSYFFLKQCCATFLHSWHTKYCRRVMAAHQPHFAYCKGGGEMVYGIDWPRQLLINRPQLKNVLFDVHNYPSLLLCHLF
jgi:hypothetical protein